MKSIANPAVTQSRYGVCVTGPEGRMPSSEARGDSNDVRYAIRQNTHPAARVRAQARAHTCAYLCVLRNYVTKKEEKKKQQVRPAQRRYAGRYVGVTRHVTVRSLPPNQIRAEVTHA
jgi:hypothetical protein